MKISSSKRSWQSQAFPCAGFARRIVFLLVVLCMLCTVPPSDLSADITNRVVATVNSDIITLYELNHSIERMTGRSISNLRQEDESRFYRVRRAVLNSLINNKITEQQIRKLGIKVTERDIDEATEKVKQDNRITQEELLHTLKLEGITMREYRERVKREIERSRLVTYEVKSKIIITEEDLKDYYYNHIEQFSEIHKVRLARILLKTANPADKSGVAKAKEVGNEILRNLEGGSDFSDMARAYSHGPAGPEGGCIGWIPFAQLDPSLKKRIAKLSPGEYTELHKCPYGIQIVKLIDEIEEGIKPFEKVRDAIYSRLYKGKVEEKYAEWLSELREESFIKVVF
jgi:peptidyl-prolyl cis-trans isomerase SurA